MSTPTHETIEEENTEVISDLLRLVNYMGNDRKLAEQIVITLGRTHRTIEQSFFRMILEVCKGRAKAEYGEDLRNEGSVKLCKDISALDAYLPFV